MKISYSYSIKSYYMITNITQIKMIYSFFLKAIVPGVNVPFLAAPCLSDSFRFDNTWVCLPTNTHRFVDSRKKSVLEGSTLYVSEIPVSRIFRGTNLNSCWHLLFRSQMVYSIVLWVFVLLSIFRYSY